MNNERITYYKEKLNKEKYRIEALIEQLKKNDMTKYNTEVSSELSFYDNHPADIATETFEVEMGRALEANEVSLLDRINDSLKAIDEGTYGKCKACGKDIEEGRLEVLPYAENCIQCQRTIGEAKTYNSNKRVVEESVIGKPFGYNFNNHNRSEVGFDAEDSYQAVESFNKNKYPQDYYYDDDDGYVEDIEKVSNEQYKDQLS